MTRETPDLIRQLAAEGAGVRPLPPPWMRAAVWFGFSLLYVVALYVLWPHPPAAAALGDQFLVQQIAALVTAVAAAFAAFATIVPGYPPRIALLPVVPLAVWLGTLGYACAQDASTAVQTPSVLLHWGCFPATLIAGVAPTIAMVTMLRKGAPLTPRMTTTLAGLAVAGLANVGIRFIHASDVSVIVLTWHVIAVFALSAVAASLGHRWLKWPQTFRG
jgi:hypothetical protein